MRILCVLAIALITDPSFAQANVSLKPSTTSFTSRGNIGSGSGDILMGLHKSHWRGIGDNGTNCQTTGFRSILQDQNSATQESYFWIVRGGTDAAGPTTGTAGLIHRFGPINMPYVAAGGAHAWILTITLSTPVNNPCEAHLSVGAEMDAQPNWPADGMSCHASTSALASQHASARDMTWQIVNPATSASHPSSKRSWAQVMRVGTPTMQMSVNGKKTIGGMFPLVGATLAAQVTNAEAGASSFFFLGIDVQATGFTFLPGTARLYLGFTKIKLLGIATVSAAGIANHPLAAVPSQTPNVTLWFQALVIGTNENLTNAQATTFSN